MTKTNFKRISIYNISNQKRLVLKMKNNFVEIKGKHEEKQDGHGQIYRHFIRKYTLSQDYDPNKLESKYSSDGVLTITAPKKTSKAAITERTIRTEEVANL